MTNLNREKADIEQVGHGYVVTIPYLRTGVMRFECSSLAELYGLARHFFYAADDVASVVMAQLAELDRIEG